MNAHGRSADRAQRVQDRADETIDQLAGSMVNVQRLLTALATASASPQDLANEMTRYGQVQGPEAYWQLTDLSLRFLSRSMLVASAYASEFLRGMLPPNRMHEVGEPPAVPHPPEGRADPSEWSAWYVMYVAWAGQQQAWSARVYQLIRDDVAAGLMSQDSIQTSSQSFLQKRLTDYLDDMTEIGMDLFADGLSAADESVRTLSDALLGEPPAAESTVEVRGQAGTIARTDLAIENNRNNQADVTCVVKPIDGIDLAIVPAEFYLAPGQTQRVSILVTLPDTPTNGSVPAGTISIAGYDDATLVVHVRATAEAAARQRITIRTLDTTARRPAGIGDHAPDDRDQP
jgi:hypothetical protein